MRKMIITFFIAILITGCSSQPDTMVDSGYDQMEMDAAIQRAIRELDFFIADLNAERSEDYGVKAPIEDGGRTEHFWLTEVSFDGEKFTGTISNEPGYVTTVTMGQRYTIGKNEISDWMFMRDGKMYGCYTLRPLLPLMPEDEAEMYRQMFATP